MIWHSLFARSEPYGGQTTKSRSALRARDRAAGSGAHHGQRPGGAAGVQRSQGGAQTVAQRPESPRCRSARAPLAMLLIWPRWWQQGCIRNITSLPVTLACALLQRRAQAFTLPNRDTPRAAQTSLRGRGSPLRNEYIDIFPGTSLLVLRHSNTALTATILPWTYILLAAFSSFWLSPNRLFTSSSPLRHDYALLCSVRRRRRIPTRLDPPHSPKQDSLCIPNVPSQNL
jgi:hypothetical protein